MEKKYVIRHSRDKDLRLCEWQMVRIELSPSTFHSRNNVKLFTFNLYQLCVQACVIPGNEAFKGSSNALMMNISRCSCRKNKD